MVNPNTGVAEIRSPAVLKAARNHAKCDTITGVPLEDEGGSGTMGNHWERRYHRDELMAGIMDVSLVSNFSAGLLEDLAVGYFVNYSNTEPLIWGKDKGCAWRYGLCNTTAGGLNDEFCNTQQYSCDFTGRRIGMCNFGDVGSALPPELQYYGTPTRVGSAPLMSFCATTSLITNFFCDLPDTNAAGSATKDARTGFYFGDGGRCAAVSANFGSQGVTTPSLPFRCLRMQCIATSSTDRSVQIYVGGQWWTCPSDQGTITFPSSAQFAGSVTCPKASLCAARKTP